MPDPRPEVRCACALREAASTVADMELIAEGLARSGHLTASGVAAVAEACVFCDVPTGVLMHPLLVRTPQILDQVDSVGLGQVLQLTSDERVLREVLAGARPDQVALTAASGPALRLLTDALVPAALKGHNLAAWRVLRMGDPRWRGQLLRALAPTADAGDLWARWVWLSAAVQRPDQLSALRDLTCPALAPAVARYARVVADGGDPAAVFTQEMVNLVVADERADWSPAGEPRLATFANAVRFTGLPQVARPALARSSGLEHVRVCAEVVAHPHLAGSDVAAAAETALDMHVAQVAGEQVVHVSGVRDLVLFCDVRGIRRWLGAGYDGPQHLELARRYLCERRDPGQLDDADRVAGAALMCADRLGGPVWSAVRAWLMPDGQRLERQGARDWALTLIELAERVHSGAGLGGADVGVVTRAWEAMGRPRWFSRLVGEYFATVPAVADTAFVLALLAVAERFKGTFDDLVATGSAIAA